MADLEGRIFTYERVGLDSRPMRLLGDGRIGRGLAKMEVGWDVFIDETGPRMVLTSLDGVPTAMLRPEGPLWRGRWEEFERCEVVLSPEGIQVQEEAA